MLALIMHNYIFASQLFTCAHKSLPEWFITS